MKKKHSNLFLFTGLLVVLTCVAMAYANRTGQSVSGQAGPNVAAVSAADGPVEISGRLTQDTVYSGGDGKVALSLALRAQEQVAPDQGDRRNADLVVVLDQSGSMEGQKLHDARQAILNLLGCLSDRDRFALIAYADEVRVLQPLAPLSDANRRKLSAAADNIFAGGGTNLGAGLKQGIELLSRRSDSTNSGKVILISDGIANQGIIEPSALGRMASAATEQAFCVSTVGVGDDFNEQLMAAIADRGSGHYHYLENPSLFAAVFEKEFSNAKAVAAASVKITVPLAEGVTLAEASGYPVRFENGVAMVFPGDLLSGRTKKLFLTLQVPAEAKREFEITGIAVDYRSRNRDYRTVLPEAFRIACVDDPLKAFASIDRHEWEEQVVFDDFNRLKEEVAKDIKTGDKRQALEKIEAYRIEKEAVNQAVQSVGVARNLENEVEKLREVVADTFDGEAGEVARKQKRNAKSLQFEGYSGRRATK